MSKPRLIVLISGSGSNLQALIDAVNQGVISAEIVLVISNRNNAYGLVRAAQAAIPTLYFPLQPYRSQGREAYDEALATLIEQARPDLIVLAGWMQIFTPVFLDHFPQRVINLHPALPDTFAGTHAIERAHAAYQAGEIAQSGCMVHYVIPEVDAGPTIIQAVVPILSADTVETFAERMHKIEHQIIVTGVNIALMTLEESVSIGKA